MKLQTAASCGVLNPEWNKKKDLIKVNSHYGTYF